MTNSIRIAQPAQLTDAQTAQLRAIWEDSFPASERGDFGEMIEDIANGTRWLFVALDADHLIGFAVLLHSIIPGVHLLEYLAIARDQRNHGLGAKLLKHLQAEIKQRGNSSGIIFEVESDDADTDERELRARRIAFYKRNGAQIIDCVSDYRVPNLAGAGTLKMKLMWLPLAAHSTILQGSQLRDCIIAIYTQSYDLPPDHPLIQQTLEQIVD
jgi:ribosomal protein S18 acetylase RimI-like enzyme